MLALSRLACSHQAIVRIAARKAVGRGKDSPAFSHRAAVSISKSFECNTLWSGVCAPESAAMRPKESVMLLSGKGTVATLRRR